MILDGYTYCAIILLMMIGFFGVASSGNLVKKLMCLGIFQVSVLLFYVSVGYVKNASVPIVVKEATIFVNPIPHVLMLTAIVVGVAVMAVGLSIAVRIKEEYGTIEEDEIFNLDWKMHEQEIEK